MFFPEGFALRLTFEGLRRKNRRQLEALARDLDIDVDAPTPELVDRIARRLHLRRPVVKRGIGHRPRRRARNFAN